MSNSLIWTPHTGPQTEVLTRNEFEILYGGARGGGKTDAGLVWLTGDEFEPGKQLIKHPRYRALILRRTADDLVDWLDRAAFMYGRYGARVVGKPPRIVWPSGAIFRTGHLKDRTSYEKYLGHEYQRMLIEELTQIGQERYYIEILGSCRSTLSGIKPQMFCTTNPPGVGHGWVKRRFVDPSPPYVPFKESGRTRVYIPASVEDNPTLIQKDPGYVSYLDGLKGVDEELYRAWRFGDWDITIGQFFQEFRRAKHTCRPFTPKSGLVKVGSMDWGYSNPHAMLCAVVEKVYIPDVKPFNRVWIYREIDGTKQDPTEVGRKIAMAEDISKFAFVRCDPAMFHTKEDGSSSISSDLVSVFDSLAASKFLPANNDRIGGWAIVHKWLSLAPDGIPYLVIANNCTDLIRTLPELVHDELNVEDIDTEGDDHWADALRYMLVHLKWIDARPAGTKPKDYSITPSGNKVLDPFISNLDLREFEKASNNKYKPKDPVL